MGEDLSQLDDAQFETSMHRNRQRRLLRVLGGGIAMIVIGVGVTLWGEHLNAQQSGAPVVSRLPLILVLGGAFLSAAGSAVALIGGIRYVRGAQR